MPTCPTCEKRFDDGATCPDDGSVLLPDELFAAQNDDLAAGTMVGEYKIEGKLGEGGFGAVYAAVHPVIGKAAAVKVLNRQFSSNPQMVSRFIAEARAVNQIRHKNIIDVFAFGALADGRQYYVMELLRGLTLHDLIKKRGRLTPDEAIPILRGVARALDAAHKNDIVHRDLKPENIFLLTDDDGIVTPKLLDFGIAKLSAEAGASHKTKTGTAMGTPYYMSPEQARGVSVDYRTDIYSFGVLTYEALTGSVPFRGESSMDILIKHMSAPVPLVSEVDPALTEANIPIIRMMAKEPGQRYESVGKALDSLASSFGIAGSSGSSASLREAIEAPPIPRPRPSDEELAKTAVAGKPEAQAETFMDGVMDTAHSQPNAASARPNTASITEAPVARRSPILYVVAAIALVAGIGLAAMFVGKNTGNDASGTSASSTVSNANASASGIPTASTSSTAITTATATATVIATATASASATPTTNASAEPAVAAQKVMIRIETSPVNAQVFQGDVLLGVAPGPFAIDKGKPTTLMVRASGFGVGTAPVSADADETVRLALKRNAPGTGTKTISKDLESPF